MFKGDEVHFDAIVIGSGFGGSFVSHPLVHADWKVLMLERGGWVERGLHNWELDGTGTLTPHFTTETPYRIRSGG